MNTVTNNIVITARSKTVRKIVSSPHHQNTFIKSREEKMQIRYYDIKMKINCTDLITVGQLAMDIEDITRRREDMNFIFSW